jgi:hypothetical protein
VTKQLLNLIAQSLSTMPSHRATGFLPGGKRQRTDIFNDFEPDVYSETEATSSRRRQDKLLQDLGDEFHNQRLKIDDLEAFQRSHASNTARVRELERENQNLRRRHAVTQKKLAEVDAEKVELAQKLADAGNELHEYIIALEAVVKLLPGASRERIANMSPRDVIQEQTAPIAEDNNSEDSEDSMNDSRDDRSENDTEELSSLSSGSGGFTHEHHEQDDQENIFRPTSPTSLEADAGTPESKSSHSHHDQLDSDKDATHELEDVAPDSMSCLSSPLRAAPEQNKNTLEAQSPDYRPYGFIPKPHTAFPAPESPLFVSDDFVPEPCTDPLDEEDSPTSSSTLAHESGFAASHGAGTSQSGGNLFRSYPFASSYPFSDDEAEALALRRISRWD